MHFVRLTLATSANGGCLECVIFVAGTAFALSLCSLKEKTSWHCDVGGNFLRNVKKVLLRERCFRMMWWFLDLRELECNLLFEYIRVFSYFNWKIPGLELSKLFRRPPARSNYNARRCVNKNCRFEPPSSVRDISWGCEGNRKCGRSLETNPLFCPTQLIGISQFFFSHLVVDTNVLTNPSLRVVLVRKKYCAITSGAITFLRQIAITNFV